MKLYNGKERERIREQPLERNKRKRKRESNVLP